MDKIVYKRNEVRDKILSGLDFLVKPVVSTLSPRGTNVVVETERGDHFLTNDGAVIARSISSKDSVENAVIEIVKEASLRTNAEAGDGTTTTVLLSSVLIKESLRMIEDGASWIDIRRALDNFADKLVTKLEKTKISAKNGVGLIDIATTSANNDKEIGKYVMDAMNVAKEEGLVFIKPSSKPNVTEVVKDLGFMIRGGIQYQELMDNSAGKVVLKDTVVLLTDKTIYYPEEAQAILKVAIKSGNKSIVIVAKDFMGEALNTLIANHVKGLVSVMLVKYPDENVLYDLATYIGSKVFTDKTGSIVAKLTTNDLTGVNQVFSDKMKTLFTPKVAITKGLLQLIKRVKNELEKDKNNDELKSRLSSLTTGVVTINVGGNTPIEINEKIYRYEDAINATRVAMKDGYLPGGGTAILKAFNEKDYPTEFVSMFKHYTEAVLRQIAENCGKHVDSVVEQVKTLSKGNGYNAMTDKYENLIMAGIVDPFTAVKLAIMNSVAVTNIIISINYYITNDKDETEDNSAGGTRTRSR